MNRLSVYDPFADVFPELLKGFSVPSRRGENWDLSMKVDLKEADGSYVVRADIPGVKKEDIHVDIDGDRVAISAEVKKESEDKEGERVLRSERYYGSVSRSFVFDSDIDEANAKASYDSGVLELTLPKKPGKTARRLSVG